MSTPVRTSAATTSSAGPASRPRLLALLVTFAVALALMATPQFTSSASAYAPHNATTAARWANNMLYLLNTERRSHARVPVRMSSKLVRAAHRHNLAMAAANTMSHQLPGERFFANRISRTGYAWQSLGENVGWNSRQTKWGLLSLERLMYREKAPNNGHRLNILGRSFRQVGIDVYFDKTHNKMWFTQDFGQPA